VFDAAEGEAGVGFHGAVDEHAAGFEPGGDLLGRRGVAGPNTCPEAVMALIRELYRPELAFLPIGDHFTMGPHEAAKAVSLLQVNKVVPMHFGTFPALTGTPEALSEKLQGQAAVWTLEPGKTVEWSADESGLLDRR